MFKFKNLLRVWVHAEVKQQDDTLQRKVHPDSYFLDRVIKTAY